MVVSPLLSQGFIYPWFPLSFHRGSFIRSILDFGGAQNMNRWMITWCHPVVWEPQGSPGRSAQNLHSSSADCANSAERRIQHLETVTMTFGPPNHKSLCAKSPCGRICCQTDFEIMIIFYIFTIFFGLRLHEVRSLFLNMLQKPTPHSDFAFFSQGLQRCQWTSSKCHQPCGAKQRLPVNIGRALQI